MTDDGDDHSTELKRSVALAVAIIEQLGAARSICEQAHAAAMVLGFVTAGCKELGLPSASLSDLVTTGLRNGATHYQATGQTVDADPVDDPAPDPVDDPHDGIGRPRGRA